MEKLLIEWMEEEEVTAHCHRYRHYSECILHVVPCTVEVGGTMHSTSRCDSNVIKVKQHKPSHFPEHVHVLV